ncbi:MAG: hypothetical protein RMX68_031180 [Aulosira sp. ZfuVER01]|nr:hypothetical protein [Aulosira sp. ZfuVER01]MDZ7998292.1 hypothetical protein [Aulosira sp. DedVER01a]MDZ8050069.1 hypothetical protein [Aulosira sp. ZfuCHP01]
MSEAHSSMLKPVKDPSTELAMALLTHYSFDLSGYSASELIRRWKNQYPIEWLHIAVIEALYQGRYKAVSVQQILNFWHRRGQATYHFNMEFERLICSKFPESLTSIPTPVLYPAKKIATPVEKTNYHLASSSANAEPSTTKADRGYSQKQLPPLKVVRETERPLANEDTEEVATSSTPSVSHADITPVDSEQPNLKPENSLQAHSPAYPASNRPQRLLPVGVNHRAIGQFTPEKSDRTESFASKLKAMSSGG